ncbi:MAG: phage terminase small subunit P27 family [Dehalococcoidia bacterium]
MGERGPLPVPHARRRNPRRVAGKVVTAKRPPMPADLPAEARAEWRRVVPVLDEIGVLATVDRGALIRYCTAWADWVELEELIRRSGKLIKGQKGNLVRNPLLLVRSDVEATLSDLGKQLGLTPAARLRADIRHERPEEPSEEEARRVTAIDAYRRRLEAS